MSVQNHLPIPDYGNLTLQEVANKYRQRGKHRFDMCLVTQEDTAPMRFKPESIALLADAGQEGRPTSTLSGVEKDLLWELPSSFFTQGELLRATQRARDARYSFYHA